MVRRRGEMGPKHPISPLAADSGAPRPHSGAVRGTYAPSHVGARGRNHLHDDVHLVDVEQTSTSSSSSASSSSSTSTSTSTSTSSSFRNPRRRRAPARARRAAAALRQRSRSRAQWNLLAGTDPHLTGGYMRVPLRAGGFGLRETSGTPGRRSTIDQVALLGARFSHPVVPAHTDAGRSTVSLRTANAGLHVA